MKRKLTQYVGKYKIDIVQDNLNFVEVYASFNGKQSNITNINEVLSVLDDRQKKYAKENYIFCESDNDALSLMVMLAKHINKSFEKYFDNDRLEEEWQ